MSWIKKAISEYDENLYLELYQKNSTTKKTFSFAPILSHPVFAKQTVTVETNTIQIIFSAYNYAYGLHLYNSFNSQKFIKFSLDKNSMTLKQIIPITEKEITENSINIKFLSPIIVREHNRETLKDYYYSYLNMPKFKEYLNINILEQMKAENLDSKLLEGFCIEEIQAKKTVIPVYEQMIEATLGIFKITGKKELLNYMYKSGIGSRKAMGFGLFEII